MDLLKKISKISYTLIILCFFLPFIPEGCDEKGKRSLDEDMDLIDSIDNQTYTPADTTLLENDSLFVESDTLITQKTVNGPTVLDKLIKPDEENLLGLGFIISYYPFILKLSSVPAALFIAMLCLYRRTAHRFFNEKSTLTYTSTGLLALIILMWLTNIKDLKTGYWLSLVFYIIAALSDLKIYLDWKKKESLFYDNNY